MEGCQKQRKKDAKLLDEMYKTWEEAAGGPSFDAFAECLHHASPELSEPELINLYQSATSKENSDAPDFMLIENDLRKKGITIKPKGGVRNMPAQQIDDLKTMSTVATLFSTPSHVPAAIPCLGLVVDIAGDVGGDFGPATRWARAGKAVSSTKSIIDIMKAYATEEL